MPVFSVFLLGKGILFGDNWGYVFFGAHSFGCAHFLFLEEKMNQELYNQLIDGASVIVTVQKFEQAIDSKKEEWGDLCVEYDDGDQKLKAAKGSYGKWKGWGTNLFTMA